jgi:hypothetical protein
MMIKRLVAVALVFGLGVALGSCSSFSDVVSDHWPHFAGGEPDGVPPRPGAPGYAAFIAHGQPQQSGAGDAQPAAAGATATGTNPPPGGGGQVPTAFTEPPPNQQPGAQFAPAAAHSNGDPGGLY